MSRICIRAFHHIAERLPLWLRKVLLYLAVLVFWWLIWYAVARHTNEALLLPTPGAVCAAWGRLAATSDFWKIILTSLGRILKGILMGIGIGSCLALVTHFLPPLYTLFYPLITVIRATPVASFIILAYLWMGRDSLPSFISVLMVLPVVWANLHEALAQTDKNLMDMAAVFRFSPWKKLRRIYLPSAMPAFAASCRSSVGLAWKAGIAAEVLTVPALSIGRQLSDAKTYMETEDMFAWTLTVILLSLILELAMLGVVRVLQRHPRRRRSVSLSSATVSTADTSSEEVI